MKKRHLLHVLWVFPLCLGIFHMIKSSPDYVGVESNTYQVDQVDFLYDLTYEDEDGQVHHDQEIFDNVLRLIDEAENFVYLDLFLFNDDYDHTDPKTDFPTISNDLTQALIDKRQRDPDVEIFFITDPINSFYGTYTPTHFKNLTDSGVNLVQTDLAPLRDSNPLYSGFYRTYFQWFTPQGSAYLPNAFRPMGPEVNIGSYMSLLNFKANHRKTVMNEKEGLVTSWNPHDGSGNHSNIAFTFAGPVLNDLLASEHQVFEQAFDYDYPIENFSLNTTEEDPNGQYQIKLITEEAIFNNILALIDQARTGDTIRLGLFYLSDVNITHRLKDASQRGVDIQLILDVNQDAFGKEKIGIPNRPVAADLMKEDNIDIRWYKSHGEQYHPKFIYHTDGKRSTIIGGSANFTRRNLQDFNLETDIHVTGPADSEFFQEVDDYYNRIWNNEDNTYTADYEDFAEDSCWKNALYYIQELSGLSTF